MPGRGKTTFRIGSNNIDRFNTCQAVDKQMFTFGDDAAASLGIAVPRVRLILFTTAALITATIVSMAGSIGFVGLVVPHVMRFFFGPLHRTLLIASALAGAILMVLADIASRLLIAPQSLPVGVVTALVGVPFFAVIIYRSRNK